MITNKQIQEFAEDSGIYCNARIPYYAAEFFARRVYEQAIADVMATMLVKRTTEKRVLECLKET
jgi:hypothetical protein